jgi:tRNA nucleotidyltransferase (CCA-adding enzyme)
MEKEIHEILQKVLERITPSKEQREQIERLAEELRDKVSKTAKEMGVEAEVRVEGSVAKDTWLSEEPDIDIFMQVSPELPRKMLGSVCLKIARKATEGARDIERFAEHPYLETFIENIRVNIVPCYRVDKGEWKSATDRTPYHTNYVKQHLNARLRSEVRLLKKFMKGTDVYGAEIKIGGFSGYLCELLTIHYGSFLEVLKSFAEWKGKTVIDIEGYYEHRNDELPRLFPEPLVMIDPVDAGRNVAAAVRREKIDLFVAASRGFLKKPSQKFFYPPLTQPLNETAIRQRIKSRGTALLFLVFGKVNAVSDVLWGQLYKTQRALRKTMEKCDFKILRAGAWSDEETVSILVFELEQAKLPLVKKHLGPPLEKKSECEEFLRKYLDSERTVCGPFVEGGRWVVEIQRRENDVVELLRRKLADGGRRVGVAERIAEAVRERFEVLLNENILNIYASNRGFAEFLTDFLAGKPKWLE